MSNNKLIKVVLAEDEIVLQHMYLTKFKAEGLDAHGASNGEEAFKLIKEIKPNIVLLDIIMPLADGFTVLKKIKEDSELKNTPVILLTNLAQDGDMEQGKKLGAIDYLVKTEYTPSQVVERIRTILK